MSHPQTLETFYTHKGNEVAFLAAKKIVELPGQVFNPFYVYGAEGLGKTHLLNAINKELSKKSATLFLSVEELERRIENKESFDSPLIVDDIQTIRDDFKPKLLRILERAVGDDLQVCFSANVAPQDVGNFSPTLCSLIESGLICDLQPALYKDRVTLIKKKAEDAGIILPDDIADALAEIGTGSITTIMNMIERLITFSSLGDLPTDADTVKSMLAEFYPRKRSCPTPSVLGILKSDEVWDLVSSNPADLKNECEQKTHAWELKGFDVSMLKEGLGKDSGQLRRIYGDFVDRVRRLIGLQTYFYARIDDMDQVESLRLESLIFDPQRVEEAEKMFTFDTSKTPAEQSCRKFGELHIGTCNQEAWQTYHDKVLHSLGTHNPCVVLGYKGTGKTLFLRAICADLVSRGKSVMFCSLLDEAEILDISDMQDKDVLILDDFHLLEADRSRFNSILTVAEICMQSNKQVFISSLPLGEDAPDFVKNILDKGLRMELSSPSADVVIDYLRNNWPGKADEIIAGGLPEFASFYDIDRYAEGSTESEHLVVPLGLPGEDGLFSAEASEVKEKVLSSKKKWQELILQRGSVNIEDDTKHLMPGGSPELIEEKF